jgi:hypothetical protein
MLLGFGGTEVGFIKRPDIIASEPTACDNGPFHARRQVPGVPGDEQGPTGTPGMGAHEWV